jgi:hypothetical protein
MSLYNKTIQSFFPRSDMCAFTGEQWFIENSTAQLSLLKVCWAGYAWLMEELLDSERFTNNFDKIMYINNIHDNYLPEKFQGYQFLETLVKDILDGKSLLSHTWFIASIPRQIKVALAAINHVACMIDVYDSEFDVYLDVILEECNQRSCVKNVMVPSTLEPSAKKIRV